MAVHAHLEDGLRAAVTRGILAARDGAARTAAAAERAWRDALQEYAATPEGRRWLQQEAELAERCGDTGTSHRLRSMLAG